MEQEKNKEIFRSAIDNGTHFKMHRRIALGKFGLGVCSFVFGIYSFADGIHDIDATRSDRTEFLEDYPRLDDETLSSAAKHELIVELTDNEQRVLIKDRDSAGSDYGAPLLSLSETDYRDVFLDVISEATDGERAQWESNYEMLEEWDEERQQQLESLYPDSAIDEVRMIGGMLLIMGSIGIAPLGMYIRRKLKLPMGNIHAIDSDRQIASELIRLLPEQTFELPMTKEKKKRMKECIDTFLNLPPIGLKLIEIDAKKRFTNHALPPEFTAERLYETLEKLEPVNKDVQIYHYAVQGRLPDEFKYAALTMILNSPYSKDDWRQAYYNAHWGSVGPMVHDGGNYNQRKNKKWSHVSGRTDFLNGVRVVLTGDDEKSTIVNHAEDYRLLNEARFMQRAALCLHAKAGTAPKSLGKEKSEALTLIWDKHVKGMQKLLLSLGVESFDTTRWFIEEPRDVEGWPTKRYEAEFEPIADSLNEIDAKRKGNETDIMAVMSTAMRNLVVSVDEVIGLDTYLVTES